MSTILAIDPGTTESAYVVIDAHARRPLHFGKLPNPDLLEQVSTYDLIDRPDIAAIEMVASYGMAVGAEVFATCVWIGRFAERLDSLNVEANLVLRRAVKLHHCHSAKAKDANITQRLVDRFALGQPNKGKGTKAEPGWFHGFAKDVWQAYALAVYVADLEAGWAE